MIPVKNHDLLRKKAAWIRLKVLETIYKTGKGHIGGTFSAVDLLVALYFGGILRFNPQNLNAKNRDRFILSKGHACLALYAIFLDLGIISKKEFESYGKDGGLGGQLDIGIGGVDFNTGSLGHSIGVGAGMAFVCKLDGLNYAVYTIIGDSELYEGSCWEAIIFAGDHKINNLVCIIDRNKFMVTDPLEENAIYKNFSTKIQKMDWDFFEMDGHKFEDIIPTLRKASASKRPSMVIANTIKGKGVSFMENTLGWYTKAPSEKEFLLAKQELEEKI